MSTNKTDIDMLRSILNDHHKSIIISFYVENIVLIAHIIH